MITKYLQNFSCFNLKNESKVDDKLNTETSTHIEEFSYVDKYTVYLCLLIFFLWNNLFFSVNTA